MTTKDKLVEDLKVVIADVEDMLRHAVHDENGAVRQSRAALEAKLSSARARLAELSETTCVKTKEAAQVADAYAKENPWKVAGAAAAVGLLLGILSRR